MLKKNTKTDITKVDRTRSRNAAIDTLTTIQPRKMQISYDIQSRYFDKSIVEKMKKKKNTFMDHGSDFIASRVINFRHCLRSCLDHEKLLCEAIV